ncbi:MAG: hypothetical protein JNL80_01845 [Phycisphaerae bacterium]|jgi:hypothetical protein|nr:hypothetical protein [Phycisphaerae bacterium]
MSHLQKRTQFLSGRNGLVAAIALASTSLSLANVTVNQWTSATSFHHARIGVPDQDQKRVGLPNSGGCYCAPTSYVNMMIYITNYGYPQVQPGPGVYTGYEHYYDVTDLLEQLGAEASISPGGDDPDDPDCNGNNDSEGEGGGDGECGSLPCGGSVTNVHNAFVADGFYGTALDDLVFIAKSLDPNAPSTSFTNIGQLAIDGSIIELCYGRYAPVGQTTGGITIYKRGGGHCVTMNGIDREGGDMSISVRDPAQDDGDIFGPSPYVTKVWGITNLAVLTTSDDPEEGPIVNVSLKVLPAIDEPHDDGKKRLVDGYFAIKPKTGIFWKDFQFVQTLPLTIGFGVDPFPHPAPNWPILDLVSDEHGLGWFALTGGNEVTPPQLVKIDRIGGGTTVLDETNAKQLAISRFDEIYVLSETPGLVERRDSAGSFLGSANVTGVPRAIACDDQFDLIYVVVPGSSGFGGSIIGYPRSLGADGAAIKIWPIANSVQLGTAGAAKLRAAVNPKDGHLWISSETTDKALGFSLPFTPRGPVSPVESVGPFGALTGLDFDDGGTLHVVDTGAVKVFDKNSSGAWTPGDAGAFNGVDVGSMVRIAKSRSNFDPAIHDTTDWLNIDADEVDDLGEAVPDCIGDLNGDAAVTAADLAVLLGQWGGAGSADLDISGTVDAADLAILLGAWGNC